PPVAAVSPAPASGCVPGASAGAVSAVVVSSPPDRPSWNPSTTAPTMTSTRNPPAATHHTLNGLLPSVSAIARTFLPQLVESDEHGDDRACSRCEDAHDDRDDQALETLNLPPRERCERQVAVRAQEPGQPENDHTPHDPVQDRREALRARRLLRIEVRQSQCRLRHQQHQHGREDSRGHQPDAPPRECGLLSHCELLLLLP